jgi:hypothetical protein
MNKTTHPIEPEEIMAYLDGELTAERAAATAAHLGGCVECQALAAELRGVSAKVAGWSVETKELEMSTAVAATLDARLPKNVSPTRAISRSWRDWLRVRRGGIMWPVAAAAAVVLVVASIAIPNLNRSRMSADLARSVAAKRVTENNEQHPRQELALPTIDADKAGGVIGGKSRVYTYLQAPESAPAAPMQQPVEKAPFTLGPMVIRTAQLSLITKEFDKARANVEAILKRHRGYVGEMKVGSAAGSGRTLTSSLRVPSDQLDATMAEMKALGRVDSESQNGQDVTSQYVDLEARLANARNTSQRLTDLLRNRTGKLSDVLEVEQELDRVRGEIEQMEAERKTMGNQVTFATLNATITEEYQSQLQVVPPSTATRLGNAAIEGYRSMIEGVVGMAVFLLTSIPTLLIWGAVLFFPSRWAWRKLRHSTL